MFRKFLITSTIPFSSSSASSRFVAPSLIQQSATTVSNNKEIDERYAKSERAKIFEGKIVKKEEPEFVKKGNGRMEWKTHPDAELKRSVRAFWKKRNEGDEEGGTQNKKIKLRSAANDVNHLRQMLHARISDASLAPLKISDLFNKVTTPWRLLDEYNVPSRTKRLQRLSNILRFLQDHNVLLHAVFRFQQDGTSVISNNTKEKNNDSATCPGSGTWNVTPHFARLVTVGETKIASEIPLRLSKVFPNATLSQLQALERRVIDVDFLAAQIFDATNMNRLVHPKDARRLNPLSKHQKATLVCAAIAELGWFVARTKATDRTHNNALFPPSDALILHVLAAHAVENLMGDLVAGLFFHHNDHHLPQQQQVASTDNMIIPPNFRINWRNFETSLVEQVPLVLSKKKNEIIRNNGGGGINEMPIIRTTEEFEGCFAENVDERDASFELLRTSPLILNLVKRNYEADMTEMEKKNLEKNTADWNSSTASASSQLRTEKKEDGFFSPTPMIVKWENLTSETKSGHHCVVPGFAAI